MKKLLLVIILLNYSIYIQAQSKNMNEIGKPIFVISNDLAQYAINHIQFNAELINKKRTFGFNFYCNIGMSKPYDPVTYKRKEVTMNPVSNGDGFYKRYYVGADAKIYPHVEAKRFKYFYSFGFESGEAICRIENQNTMTSSPNFFTSNTYYYYSNYSVSNSTRNSSSYFTNNFWGIHHKHGCLWTITNRLFLEAEINVGLNRFIGPDRDSDGKKYRYNSIKFGGGFHLGFAF